MKKCFSLMVAPNGARRRKSDHPALPETTLELAKTARDCFAAGADRIHLHVRDNDGRHSLDAGRYREAIAAISESAPEMGIQITTESAGRYGVEEQFTCLEDLRPDAASISIREMSRDPDFARRTYALTAETGTEVQHILYSPQCVAQFRRWRENGVIGETRSQVVFVLGQYTPPVLARPGDLNSFAPLQGDDTVTWAVCAFGRHEQDCLLEAIRRGGQPRIGFENNTQRPDSKSWTDNAESVRSLVRAALAEGFSTLRSHHSESA